MIADKLICAYIFNFFRNIKGHCPCFTFFGNFVKFSITAIGVQTWSHLCHLFFFFVHFSYLSWFSSTEQNFFQHTLHIYISLNCVWTITVNICLCKVRIKQTKFENKFTLFVRIYPMLGSYLNYGNSWLTFTYISYIESLKSRNIMMTRK